jgi:Ca2+-binding EF-hand superfamily protein
MADEQLVGRVEDTFHIVDANNSGSLSFREIVLFIKQAHLGDAAAAIQANVWFDSMDGNQDTVVRD